MDKLIDVADIDDKISWRAITTLSMQVRRADSNEALCLQCVSAGSTWMLTKMVVMTGGFKEIVGMLGTQEQAGMFDDLQEAIAAGNLIAKKWLADPTADTAV